MSEPVYVIADPSGSDDVYYHILNEFYWTEFRNQFKLKERYYDVPSALDAMFERVGLDRESHENDIYGFEGNTEWIGVRFATSFSAVWTFCQEKGLEVVGGRG